MPPTMPIFSINHTDKHKISGISIKVHSRSVSSNLPNKTSYVIWKQEWL